MIIRGQMSANIFSQLISGIEEFFTDLLTDLEDFTTSAFEELVKYAPQVIDIALIGVIAGGITYALRNVITGLPFMGPLISGLGRLLHF